MSFHAALKAQLEIAGISQRRLAQTVGWSPALISAFSTGKTNPKRDQVAAIDDALAAGGMLIRHWMDDRRRAAQPSWMRKIDDIDAMASEIRINQPTILPAVTQSLAYAVAIIEMGSPGLSPDAVHEAARKKVEKADRLLQPEGPHITVVVPMGVLRAATEIAPDALTHLLAVTESATVQVLPDGIHLAAALGAFRVISFTDRLPVAFVEHASGGGVIDHGPEVERFSIGVNRLAAWALDPAESRKKIEELT
ncbi:helix-turn-helix transcriptional regulator [Nocardiopsis sediminis]|uniref:Helix-turn-helix transcriptional regulator n=1 Tax=Nocardiopsis sediminis TaxID=1778267 RepID=A0ABV8FPC7_9ACTN